jgi:predicted RNA-binding protein with PIN domain
MIVFVDGHNALHVLGVDAGNHEADRGALVRSVRERVRLLRPGATVFFDGHPPPGEFAASQARGVRVVFSLHREADDAIVDAVRDADEPRRVLVVTDDLELARRVAQLGAVTARVRAFFAQDRTAAVREDARDGEVAHPSDARGLSDAEIAEMERKFVSERRRTPGTLPKRAPTRRPRPR